MKQKFLYFLLAMVAVTALLAPTLRADAEPKRYVARLTQSGTGAPTTQILENTLGDIEWEVLSDGVYRGTLNDAFPLNKTVIWGTRTWFDGGPGDGRSAFAFTSSSQAPDHIIVTTNVVDMDCLCVYETGNLLADANVLPIEIVVYP